MSSIFGPEPRLLPQAIRAYHEEVLGVLTPLGNPAYGRAVAADRGSQLEYLGVSFPDVRAAVKRGFSFYALDGAGVLAVWDGLWRHSPYGEVLFAALEYYTPRAKKGVVPGLWAAAHGWTERVDNWCHTDGLSALYSRILERQPTEVLAQLRAWNQAEDLWLRRISMVSLIHYTGKNSVFLPPETVLPFVANCLDDDRHYVQKAAGWVLREMARAYPAKVTAFMETHSGELSATALARATERAPAAERERLRAMRTAARLPQPRRDST